MERGQSHYYTRKRFLLTDLQTSQAIRARIDSDKLALASGGGRRAERRPMTFDDTLKPNTLEIIKI